MPSWITEQQRQIEALAFELIQKPDTQAMVLRTQNYWLEHVAANGQLKNRFEHSFNQAMLCAAMALINSDPNYPQIHGFGRFPYELDGLQIPGTRAGHPVADYLYRFAPVDGEAHYILRGKIPGSGPAAIEIGLVTPEQAYLGTLSKHELVTDEQGNFCISIDPSPADGRHNHLQSQHNADQLIIRDILNNVATDKPCELSIERIDPPTNAQRDQQYFIDHLESALKKFVDDLLGIKQLISTPANVFTPPALQSSGQELVTQAYSTGHFQLTDNEALVIHLSLGDAAYAVVPVTDYWGGIGDFKQHRSCLGTGRAHAHSEGRYCFVVSSRDPGIEDWIDTGGLQQGLLIIRWVGFEQGRTQVPELNVILTRLDKINESLPEDIKQIDKASRELQMQQHRRDYHACFG